MSCWNHQLYLHASLRQEIGEILQHTLGMENQR